MASNDTGPGGVGQFKVLKTMPRRDEALDLLKRLHSLCKPIQKKYGWYLPELVEFFPDNPNLLGMNMNAGQKIFIRLRPAFDKDSFLPLEESLVGTLLHEFTHNVHAPHNKDFYAFLDKLQDEYDALRASGYTGEGFLSDGKKLGVSHNLPAHLAKAKALEEAERRNRLAKIMGPPGGRTLGGGSKRKTLGAKTPRELMLEAAERRARDAKSCGQGEDFSDATIQEEMHKAEDQGQAAPGVSSEIQDGRAVANGTGDGDGTSAASSADQRRDVQLESKRKESKEEAGGEEEEDEDSDIEILAGPPLQRPGEYKPPAFHPHAPKKIHADGQTSRGGSVLGKRPLASTTTTGKALDKDPGRSSAAIGKDANGNSKPARAPMRSAAASPSLPSASSYWSCSACTFENQKSLALACEVCGTERTAASSAWSPGDYVVEDDELAAVSSGNFGSGSGRSNQNAVVDKGWICHRCGGVTEHDFWTCRLCGIMKLSS